MRRKEAKKVCRLCGADLAMWGDDVRVNCPDCLKAMKDTKVKCAGKCKKLYPLRYMDTVSVFFEPGKKGGRKIKLHYCSKCLLLSRSRISAMSEEQQETLRKKEERLRRGSNGKDKEKERK